MLAKDPAQTIRNWARLWGEIFSNILNGSKDPPLAKGLYEPCSLIVARWEVLGSLFTGYSNRRSDRDQAMDYVERFLKPINPRYVGKHPVLRQDLTIASMLFQMLRNGSLHGFTPAGIYDPAKDMCIGWGVDYDGHEHLHLQFDRGHLIVNAATLLRELLDSMEDFAKYLESNPGAANDFRNALWWRFAPSPPNKAAMPEWKL
jgi:hypothetical protein